MVSRTIFERLYLVIDQNGNRLRYAGYVAADHQHKSEFTQGVCKAECNAGDDPRNGKWKDHAIESAEAVGAQCGRGGEQLRIDRCERGGERLHCKREAINERTDDQAFKRESKSMAGERLVPAPDGAQWAECDQRIKTEHGRRQDKRQGYERFNQERPSFAMKR